DNGIIDSGAELFGEQTVLADGTKAANGFAALVALDSNGNGVVDADDPAFSTLRVWRDANGNGSTDAGELLSLSDLGITSFSLTNTATNSTTDGGTLTATGNFIRTNADGTTATGVMGDFNFNNDTIHSQYTDHIAVPGDIVALPDIQGLGKLRDLREAAALSPALAQDLKDFAAATTRGEQRSILINLLYDWAKTSPGYRHFKIDSYEYGFIEDPKSDNVIYLTPGQTYAPVATELDDETTMKIEVVEAVLGENPLTDLGWSGTNLPLYSQIYDEFFEGAYAELAGQSRLSSYINAVG